MSSNLEEIAAFVDGERVGRGDLATNTMAFLAPERSDFETLEIEISASGPAPPAPDPYRLRQVIEIPTMPSDRVAPTPPGELRPTARVRNFYDFEVKTQRLPVFRPATLAELRARSARRKPMVSRSASRAREDLSRTSRSVSRPPRGPRDRPPR